MSPVAGSRQFDNFRDCVISGYEQSTIILKTLPIEEINSKQLYTKFVCKPQIET